MRMADLMLATEELRDRDELVVELVTTFRDVDVDHPPPPG